MIHPSAAASDPSRSAWVAANAGAGKTYTLANRVTRLLLAGARPERILCLTFTKAAAAEMQGRLFTQLGNWSMLPDDKLREAIESIGALADDLAKARRLFAQALETPGGLKVLTIHAFCQIVLSRFPIEAGVPPGFEVLDEQSARRLIAEARQAALERAANGDADLKRAVNLLVSEASEARLGDMLAAALGADRRKIDRFFAGLGGAPFAEAVWRAHGATPGVDPGSSFCTELRRDIAQLKAVRDWLAEGGKNDQARSEYLTKFLTLDLSADGFTVLAGAFLTASGAPRKNMAVKKLADARPDLLAYLTELQERYCAAEDRRRAARAAGLAEAALTLIHAVRGHYFTAKEARGVLDYDDLIVKTRDLLYKRQAAAWVLYKLDGGIDHVLIDEAQDTSPEQWEIVGKLTEEFFAGETRGRTIFAVGDEKQSIFSFQGADPSQFAINRDRFAALAQGAGQSLLDQPLTMSRRSAPEVLRFVDQVFEDAAARAGLTFRDAPIAHEAHRATAKGAVEFWTALPVAEGEAIDPWRPVDVEQPDSPVLALAEKIAGTISGWLRTHAALPGHDSPIRPGDIMILLPRRNPFGPEIIRQLKLRGIPVAGADRIILTEQIAVMDLMALARFVLQREDDLNLAALLRSPLCGLSEDELFALCHGRAGSLWQALTREADRFALAHAFLSEMLERADYAPPFEFFSHALIRLGKRSALLARLGPESADAIDEFLSLALSFERGQTPSLESFLNWLSEGQAEIKRDMERERDDVRVMTVHGAKGLEADIVILPDTTSLPDPPSRKGHLLFDDGAVLFPLAEGQAPERVRAAKDKELAETLKEHHRLLYVALTRARERLYVCGFENARGVRDGSWYRLAEAAAKALGRSITRGGEDVLAFGHAEEERAAPVTGAQMAKAVLPGWAGRPAPREIAKPRLIRPSDALALSEPASLSPLGQQDRFKRGNVVHALLARLPDLPVEERRGAALRYAQAQGFGAELVDETLAVLDHPDFAPAFGPGSRAEVPFLSALPEFGEGAQLAGRIDRLAVRDDEVLIVDFKTNRPPPPSEETVSPVYLAQMALYRAAAEKIFPGRRIACALVWTDGPRLMRLSDAILDRQRAELAGFHGQMDRLDPDQTHS